MWRLNNDTHSTTNEVPQESQNVEELEPPPEDEN
jgi:hypothetical protein